MYFVTAVAGQFQKVKLNSIIVATTMTVTKTIAPIVSTKIK
jgi:hypothetical protein